MGTALILGFGKLADSGLAPFIAIFVCALAGVPSAGVTLVVRWARRDAADLSVVAILLGSAIGITAAAVFMHGWNTSDTGRGLPTSWRPMMALAYTLSRGIKDGHGKQILGLVAGASFGTFLGSMWKRVKLWCLTAAEYQSSHVGVPQSHGRLLAVLGRMCARH